MDAFWAGVHPGDRVATRAGLEQAFDRRPAAPTPASSARFRAAAALRSGSGQLKAFFDGSRPARRAQAPRRHPPGRERPEALGD